MLCWARPGSLGERVATMSTSIVLADDEPILRTIYAEALRRAGFEVREAADGREALAIIALEAPALLILDAWMPDVNGFEVLDSLRHDPSSMGMKVVMLSNLDDSDSRLEGFSSGLSDWWVKGIGLDVFIDKVRDLLADDSLSPGHPSC